jgi:hypothetical protein
MNNRFEKIDVITNKLDWEKQRGLHQLDTELLYAYYLFHKASSEVFFIDGQLLEKEIQTLPKEEFLINFHSRRPMTSIDFNNYKVFWDKYFNITTVGNI